MENVYAMLNKKPRYKTYIYMRLSSKNISKKKTWREKPGRK